MHAATFGGNPIAARAGIAAIEMIEQEDCWRPPSGWAEVFRTRLEELAGDCEHSQEVRVAGVMIGDGTGRRRAARRAAHVWTATCWSTVRSAR